MSHRFSARNLLLPTFVVVVLATSGAWSQPASSTSQVIPVRAVVQPNNPVLGEPITLQLQFPVQLDKLDIPNFEVEGLDLEYTGAGLSAISTPRGRRTIFRLTYDIQVDEPGSYSIPSKTFDIGNYRFQTNPVSFTVEKGADKFWAELKLGDSDLYLGQMVTAELSVYFDPRLQVVETPRQIPTSFEGFTIGDWQRGRRTNGVRLEDGRQALKHSYVVALAPVKTGKLTLAPVKTQWGIVNPRRSSGPSVTNDSFLRQFFNRMALPGSLLEITVDSEPVEVTVKPLPEEGRPATFSGAIGKFGMLADVKSEQVKVGEPLELTMRVSGQGNFERVGEPALTFDEDHWQTYDSESEFRALNETGTDGQKIFTKILIPKTVDAKLPVIEFSYFDPNEERYLSVKPVTDLEVEIIGGPPPTQYLQEEEEEEKQEPEPAPEQPDEPEPEPEEAVADIRGIKTLSDPDIAGTPNLLSTVGFWAVQTAPLAGLLALLCLHLSKTRAGRKAGEQRVAELRREQRDILQQIESAELSERELYTRAGRYLVLTCALANDQDPDPDRIDDSVILDHCERNPQVDDLLAQKNNYLYGAPGRGQEPAPNQESRRIATVLQEFAAGKNISSFSSEKGGSP